MFLTFSMGLIFFLSRSVEILIESNFWLRMYVSYIFKKLKLLISDIDWDERKYTLCHLTLTIQSCRPTIAIWWTSQCTLEEIETAQNRNSENPLNSKLNLTV